MMPQILWTQYFLDEQGYSVEHSLHQDNTSAQRLEINGKMSSGKRTKHMNVRYFFIADRVGAGDFVIDDCHTDEMVGDFFTKPLQGSKYKYFRALIMGFEMKSNDGQKLTWGNFVA